MKIVNWQLINKLIQKNIIKENPEQKEAREKAKKEEVENNKLQLELWNAKHPRPCKKGKKK